MPLLTDLDFAARDLLVAYRASPDPQDVTIDVTTPALPGQPMAHWSMMALVEAINDGAAGGATFPPSAGVAQVLSGPMDAQASTATRFHWVVRLAGVAPLFVRTMVEELRVVGFQHPLTAMQITGSLPVDASPLSVREGHVRQWLDDPNAYLEAWPTPGFPLKFIDHERDEASVRLVLERAIDPVLRERLEELAIGWVNAVRNYVSDEGAELEGDHTQCLPTFGSGGPEFRAVYKVFRYTRLPARAILTNVLTRFHQAVAPIVEAEVRS